MWPRWAFPSFLHKLSISYPLARWPSPPARLPFLTISLTTLRALLVPFLTETPEKPDLPLIIRQSPFAKFLAKAAGSPLLSDLDHLEAGQQQLAS
jgi:hypothetical protein